MPSKEISSYFKPQEVKNEEDSIVGNILPASIANLSIQSNQTEANFTEQIVHMPYEDIRSLRQSIVPSFEKRSLREMSSINNASFYSSEQQSLEDPII